MSRQTGDPLMQSLEKNILELCEAAGSGLSDADIRAGLNTDVKPALRIGAYNKLLSKGRLRLSERRDSSSAKPTVVYQWVSAKEAKRFQGLDSSDRLIYNLIQKAGQDGASSRELKMRSNIQNGSEVKHILDRLMSRSLIKEIKSIQGSKKKIYILSELDPSPAHTGGPWYNDEKEFDTEFIEAMYAQVLNYIRRQQHVTVEQVTNFVSESKLANEELTQKDIKALMSTMLYDGAIQTCPGPSDDDAVYYRHVVSTPAVNHLAGIPCGSCPLAKDCAPDGVISPKSCVYLSEWLNAAADW